MFEKMKDLIIEYVDVDAEKITPDAKFIDDLGFSSYDFMSFLGALEDEFDIEIDERKAVEIRTVGEAADYIASLQ